jgi:uncharacterized pyridoxal phosphate-containing UPF0001 family protein
MSIATNIKIQSTLPENVTLVAVSKPNPVSDLMKHTTVVNVFFGENKIQEMADKWEQMPKDIQWHMTCTNQQSEIHGSICTISAWCDSLKLLQENKQAAKNERVIDCLLQMHIAKKFTYRRRIKYFDLYRIARDEKYKIVGLMGMATLQIIKTKSKRNSCI